MNRRQAIRNSLMALAVSLVPRVLQPSMGELVDDNEILGGEEMVEITFNLYTAKPPYYEGGRPEWDISQETKQFPKSYFPYGTENHRFIMFKS